MQVVAEVWCALQTAEEVHRSVEEAIAVQEEARARAAAAAALHQEPAPAEQQAEPAAFFEPEPEAEAEAELEVPEAPLADSSSAVPAQDEASDELPPVRARRSRVIDSLSRVNDLTPSLADAILTQ